MEPPIWAWVALIGAVPVLTAIDLLLFGRGQREVSTRQAAIWSACWISLGLGFTGVIAAMQGGTAAGEYLSGYLIEWSLSIDNLFVFAVIFTFFAVPKEVQPRVLLYGVLGALVFRGIFIAIGAAALSAADWVIYIFGAFLVFTAYRLARSSDEHVDPSQNKLLALLRRVMPVTDEYHGNQATIVRDGVRMATPVLAVLLVVASTDVVFAIDSIPAIFAITDEAYIVLAANIFAVLGLRAMFFVIVGALARFKYLNYGLSAVLALVGVKMLLADVYHPPVWVTLPAVVLILGIAVGASLWATRNDPPVDPEGRVLTPAP